MFGARCAGDRIDCPRCSKRIPWAEVRFSSSFSCPACDSKLAVPDFYTRGIGYVSLLVASVLAYVVGARGFVLAGVIVVGFFPVAAVVSLVGKRLVPPFLIFADE